MHLKGLWVGEGEMNQMKNLLHHVKHSILRSVGIIFIIVLWEIIPRAGIIDIAFLSPPSQVLAAFGNLYKNGVLFEHLFISLKRALSGFVAAIVVGIFFGLFVGYFKKIEGLLDSTFQTFRQISAFALFPVFIIFFGIGEFSKDLIIFWAAIWSILLNTISGVQNVDKLLINSAKSMGASQSFIFRKIILPAAAPEIFTGIRLGGSHCIMALVAAEMIGAHSGIGYLVMYSQETFKIPEMYAAIVGLAILGLGLNYLLQYLERSVTSWKQRG